MSGYRFRFYVFIIVMLTLPSAYFCQSRIKYENKDIFLSGANVAWVNFAGDIGRGATNISAFKQIFSDLHKSGGNCMRLWLHTAASNSPEFDSRGIVTGPGKYTISDLRSILDEAQKNRIGLMLCLWSFDMLRISFGKTVTDRGSLMLTDTAFTNAYIKNSLIPMVKELKGHPAILAWEIFNEPEGMSNEYGWDMTYHVPMSNIQRFINLTTGAIHRTDPAALVTNGSWSFKAQSDIITTAADKNAASKTAAALSVEEKEKIEKIFRQKYNAELSAEKIIEKFSPDAAVDMNYYRDDRLINAGGDLDGKLDFYTVHYYDWANVPLSPFHFPVAHWGLNKALVVAEFYIQDTFGVPALELYKNLIDNGYAGALAWAWYGSASTQELVKASSGYLYKYYNEEVNLDQRTGDILYFEASKQGIEKGEPVMLYWGATKGSKVTLNGVEKNYKDSMSIAPAATTTYRLIASGEMTDTLTLTINILQSGKILAFTARPPKVAPGEKTTMSWKTVKGSTVKLNGAQAASEGEAEFTIKENTRFVLTSGGEIKDTAIYDVFVYPAEMINRCLNAKGYVSSSEKGANANPANLTDGLMSTKWSSAYIDQQWFIVDLERQHEINKLVFFWDVNYAKKYRVGISEDSLNWSLAAVKTDGTGGTEIIDNLTEKGRYIKVMLDQRATNLGSALFEFNALGKQAGITDVKKENALIPDKFALKQNYPNPFNPSTVIGFNLPVKGKAILKIYDILGNEVKELLNEEKEAGKHEVKFEASGLASGVYFCRMVSGSFCGTIKMLFLK